MLSELHLTVNSLGNTRTFALVRPFVSAAPATSPEDIRRLLSQPWTLATLLQHDNHGSISYALECEDASAVTDRLSIHARDYRSHEGKEEE